MTSARLRITHAGTAAESVYGDVLLSDDALVSRTSVSAEGAVEVGGVSVVLTTDTVLGVAKKPLPPGRHRAVVERLVGSVWQEVASGTVSNERAACGSTRQTPASSVHAGAAVRRWTLEVADTALPDALDALGAEPLVDVATGTPVPTGVAYGDGTVEVSTRDWFDVRDALAAAATEAGITLTGPGGGALPSVVDEPTGAVAVASPHPDRETSCPDWTARDLLDWWRALRPLLVSAAYAPYPSADLSLVVQAGPVPSDFDSATGLIGLDDVDQGSGPDRAWEDADWTTEPSAIDGQVYDDLALAWQDGPDGSRVDSPGVIDAPLAATYAAARPSLTGTKAAARDGGRKVSNASLLELTARLPGHDAASLATAADGASGEVDTAAPAIDIDDSLVEAIYAAVLVNVGGTLRSVVERRPPGAPATMELWATARYEGVSARYADRDRLPVEVPLGLVAGLVPGTVSIGAEGLAWAAAEVEADHDNATARLTLVRPTALSPGALPEGTDRSEPAPTVSATSSDYLDTDDGGSTTYRVDTLDVSASVPVSAEAVASWEIEEDVGGGTWVARDVTTTGLRSALHYDETEHGVGANPPNAYDGNTYRARATYPSGTVTDWAEATVTA